MLDKELDKLRDKTLSFWCHIISKSIWIYKKKWIKVLWHNWWWDYMCFYRVDTSENKEEYKKDFWYCLVEVIKNGSYEIIWHPINYWRIYSLSYKLRNTKSWKVADEILYNKTDIERILKENDLMDKTELERQKSPHWEDLRELLIQFSNYL